MKSFLRSAVFRILLSASLLCPFFLSADGPQTSTASLSNKELETIAKITSVILGRQHYLQHPMDDKMSALLYDEYFKELDPQKIFFCKEDINKFKQFRYKLDDYLAAGDIKFAFEVYKVFLKRLDAYEAYAYTLLAQGFTFTENEDYDFNRADEDWVENEADLKELWRKKLKNDVLTLMLVKKVAETEPQEGNEHPSWLEKSPYERIKKRVAQTVSFFKKKEPLDILETYLSSLARAYDPHSEYMSPRSEEDFNISMRLSLMGIGATLTSEDGYTKVVKVVPGGPADLDGRLKADDRIVAVAQENAEPVDVIDMPLNKVVAMIRGPENTKVSLTVLDGSKGLNAIPKTLVIKRGNVKLTESEAKGRIQRVGTDNGKELKIGIITLPSFYMDFDAASKGDPNYKSSTNDVLRILKDFKKEKVDGIVLDMRSNGGGSLKEAVRLTGLFIKNGPVVQVKNGPSDVDIQYDEDETVAYDGPLAVLINRLSASATEIFAGAIKDYNRGLILGDFQTHGKGTVQTVFELKTFLAFIGANFPAGSVKFTNAKFYRVNGNSTQIKGVTPDIVFPSFTEFMELGEERLGCHRACSAHQLGFKTSFCNSGSQTAFRGKNQCQC